MRYSIYEKYIKRVIDFFFAVLALPFVIIIILIVSPFIICCDGWPVFYNAKRMGRYGNTFKMYKFRSMKNNSPDIRQADGSTYNGEDDLRVTKVGKILRKTSIDEIPQLLNVLVGDMSFVGPRPTLPTLKLEDVPAEQRKRYDVRPGITGYAQAYYRNSISQEEKFKYDSWYAENVSFFLDIKIIAKTGISVLRRDNIYIHDHKKDIEGE